MLVAVGAIRRGAFIPIGMATGAVGSAMFPLEWEAGFIVVKIFSFITIRVTGQACRAGVHVAIYVIMLIIHFALVVLMARDACEFSIIGRVWMTLRTVIPFSLMLT